MRDKPAPVLLGVVPAARVRADVPLTQPQFAGPATAPATTQTRTRRARPNSSRPPHGGGRQTQDRMHQAGLHRSLHIQGETTHRRNPSKSAISRSEV